MVGMEENVFCRSRQEHPAWGILLNESAVLASAGSDVVEKEIREPFEIVDCLYR